MSEEEQAADEFMGHRPPPEPAAPRPDAGGVYTLSGEARNVRPFTEDTGWGEYRQTIQVVSFTLDQFASGGLTRSVYAEIRGRTIARRPVENEAVTITGRFVGGRFEVRTLAGLRDDPHLPVNAPAPRRRRRLLFPLGCAALMLLFVCGVPLGVIAVVSKTVGPELHLPGTSGPHKQPATGPGPWIIKNDNYTYEVVSASRTTTSLNGQPTSTVTVHAFVTHTAHQSMSSAGWELRNQDAERLTKVDDPLITRWEVAPTFGERLPITLVALDSTPAATTLTLTLSDFFGSEETLILKDIPVT